VKDRGNKVGDDTRCRTTHPLESCVFLHMVYKILRIFYKFKLYFKIFSFHVKTYRHTPEGVCNLFNDVGHKMNYNKKNYFTVVVTCLITFNNICSEICNI